MDSEYYIFHDRLAQFRSWSNTSNDWDEKWSSISITNLYNLYLKGYLDEFELFTQYLPKDKRILEAGCGLGQLVAALSARGYQVEGVDYSEKTIERVKEHLPGLNVRYGNVYDLDVPNGYYAGYISIGVFEHDPNGPLLGLTEAKRILASDGTAFVSVPFLNKKRSNLSNHKSITKDIYQSNGLSFYQYYFSVNEFSELLRIAGFDVIKKYPYAVFAGLTRDYKFGRWLLQHRFFSNRLRNYFESWCRQVPIKFRFLWGHMLMYVCKPI